MAVELLREMAVHYRLDTSNSDAGGRGGDRGADGVEEEDGGYIGRGGFFEGIEEVESGVEGVVGGGGVGDRAHQRVYRQVRRQLSDLFRDYQDRRVYLLEDPAELFNGLKRSNKRGTKDTEGTERGTTREVGSPDEWR